MFLPENTYELKSYLICSVIMIVSTLFAVFSLKMVSVSIFSILFNMKPVIIMLLSYSAGEENLSIKKLIFILLSFLGTGLIVDSEVFKKMFHFLLGIKYSLVGQPSSVRHGNFITKFNIY
jgi:drug/metabolite transporter (DMT)-like permease